MLTTTELRVLNIFRQFRIVPGRMLCFHGPQLKTYQNALRQMSEKGLLVPEKIKGGYSLTDAGFAAMMDA